MKMMILGILIHFVLQLFFWKAMFYVVPVLEIKSEIKAFFWLSAYALGVWITGEIAYKFTLDLFGK